MGFIRTALVRQEDAIFRERGPHREELGRRTWQQTFTFNGHTKGVQCLAVSPDGNIVASGSRDGTIRLWRAATTRSMRSRLTAYPCPENVRQPPASFLLVPMIVAHGPITGAVCETVPPRPADVQFCQPELGTTFPRERRDHTIRRLDFRSPPHSPHRPDARLSQSAPCFPKRRPIG